MRNRMAMPGFYIRTISMALALAAAAHAQLNKMPAARAHGKMNGTTAVKYTSKLQTLAELNFTLGNDHPEGKNIIAASLDRISKTCSLTAGGNAFTVKHIIGPNAGAGVGLQSFGIT